MEKIYKKIMKVVPDTKLFLGHLKAVSFEEFYLQMVHRELPSTFLDGLFTDIYFMTISGNIYKIFNKIDSVLQSDNWFMVNKNNPDFIHVLEHEEIQTGVIRLNKSFYYGRYYLTTPVTEIVCLDRNKCYLNISDFPDSDLVSEFEQSIGGENYLNQRLWEKSKQE